MENNSTNNTDEEERPLRFWNRTVGQLFILGIFLTVLGYLLVFLLPPSTGPAPLYVLFGLVSGIFGMILMLSTAFYLVIELTKSSSYRNAWITSIGIYRKSLIPTLTGGLAYVFVSSIQASLLSVPQELRSPATIQVAVDELIGGLFISLCIAFYAVKIANHGWFKGLIMKSIIFSLIALLIVTILVTLIHLSDSSNYFLLFFVYDIPRYLALGLVVGFTLERQSKTTLESTNESEKSTLSGSEN